MDKTLLEKSELTNEEWESICRKCAKCCYEKIDLGNGHIVYTEEPCIYLDTATRMCKIYDKRQEIEPDCIKLTENFIRQINWMPSGCAYVEYLSQKDTLQAVRIVTKSKRHKRVKLRRD
ncbi:MAG: YkgJ family cysteine cluster protein [Desulfomonilaceae bacterium]